jgi:hypothetical protein
MSKPNRTQPFPAPIQKAANQRPTPTTPTPQAPPPYRPQAVPKCLQLKAATPPPTCRPQPTLKALQREAASAPSSYKGGMKRPPVAPPVYRPLSPPKGLQRKEAGGRQRPPSVQSNHSPAAPPAYRPPSLPKALRPSAADSPGLRAAVRSNPSPGAAAVQCQLVPYHDQDSPKGYYEDTRARDTLFTRLDNGWYMDSLGIKYLYLTNSAQYQTAEGFFWDPITKRLFLYENGAYRARDGSGYYYYNAGVYTPSQQPQVSQYPPILGQTNTVSPGVISYPVSNTSLHTATYDKEEEEPVTMSSAALDRHLPSGEETEVDGVELHMVLGRIRAAYRSGSFESTRPTDFKNRGNVLPVRPDGHYKEFAEKKQSHWRVVVGWDPYAPESIELYFNSGRSGGHYGDDDWWRYNPNRKQWEGYP